ncbi:MAG: exodeoxyribonuclease VII large subunit [Alphaproteobacteria bacterium]|nr:exodeoxyribonuclease VII large subunit [Alphaproteobacteria bacterium]
MSAPAPDPAPPGNLPVLSVGELSLALKKAIEDSFGRVRVRGELSGFKRAASGHLYMSLKDQDAVLDAVCWRGTAARLAFLPEDGLEVICTGRVTTYAARSRYQLVIETMEPAGVGALMALLEERRKKLAAEGLFDEARKRPLPYLPEVIGVVTSPTGAVIRDILHRFAERFPRRVLLWPVLVQGDQAAAQVAAAIAGFDGLAPGGAVPRPDVVIVARGGGSIEDLWPFNEEVVVRAVAASRIPVISAVGHESDTTLIDFVADRRAPTPTAAAEMAVPVRADLVATVLDLERRLVASSARLLEARASLVRGLARGLRDPSEVLAMAIQRLDDLSERLKRALSALAVEGRARLTRSLALLRPRLLEQEIARLGQRLGELGRGLGREGGRALLDAHARLSSAGKLLMSYSYARVLERGYAVVRDVEARLLSGAKAARPGMALEIEFHDGRARATVDGAAPRRSSRGGAGDAGAQGSLL